MRITSFEATTFRYKTRVVRDEEGHTHPGAEHDAIQTLFTVKTDEGVAGYCLGGSAELAQLATTLLGRENPLDREKIWQRLRHNQRAAKVLLSDRNIGIIDQVLWDFAGRLTNLPASKLIGSYREKVPAYGSTMCGDDISGGLDSPEAYAEFAVALKNQGYKAIKLHTWMPPLARDPRRDVAACRAVREADSYDIVRQIDRVGSGHWSYGQGAI